MIETKTLPSGMLKPGVYGELNTSTGANALPANIQPLLLIGQRTSAGVQSALKPLQIFGAGEAAAAFGTGSVAHRMALSAFKVSTSVPVFLVAVDDAASSAAATAVLTLTGTSTAAGSIVAFFGNDRLELGVAAGVSPGATVTALVAAVNAATYLPITAETTTDGVAKFTFKNKGTVGNQLTLNVSCSAAGMSLSSQRIDFAGGTVDPDLQPALDKVFAGSYVVYAHYLQDALSCGLLKAHVDTISGSIEQRPARAVVGTNSTVFSNATTLSATLNDERDHIAYARGCRKPGYELAAATAASLAEETDPAVPLDGKVVPGIDVPDTVYLFSRSEQEALLSAGVTPLEPVGSDMTIVRMVTTRTKTAGTTDLTLLDTGTIACMDYVRLSCNTRIKLVFGRATLDDRTPALVVIQAVDVLYRLQDLRIVQQVDKYKAYVTCDFDANAKGRLRLRIPSPIVYGLHQIFELFDLILV